MHVLLNSTIVRNCISVSSSSIYIYIYIYKENSIYIIIYIYIICVKLYIIFVCQRALSNSLHDFHLMLHTCVCGMLTIR